jgi:hypothetical protein
MFRARRLKADIAFARLVGDQRAEKRLTREATVYAARMARRIVVVVQVVAALLVAGVAVAIVAVVS